MSLLSKYLAAVGGRKIPHEVSLRFAESLKGASVEQQQKYLDNFIIDVLSEYPIEDMSRFMSTFYEEYLPEDDPFVKAFRERNIPLYSRLAYAEYAAGHLGEEGEYLRNRLAEEMEMQYPLKKWAARMYSRQEGKPEEERQRLELEAVLRQNALLESLEDIRREA
ncbi:MAG: hypothetical protein E7331_10535 [Clostridiales bacterium]|nr:hypothetical protein [Clostridiales bacterium]